jgi:hypothetical protein
MLRIFKKNILKKPVFYFLKKQYIQTRRRSDEIGSCYIFWYSRDKNKYDIHEPVLISFNGWPVSLEERKKVLFFSLHPCKTSGLRGTESNLTLLKS